MKSLAQHITEGIFDDKFTGDFSWMKMKHHGEYLKILDKIKEHRESISGAPDDIVKTAKFKKGANVLLQDLFGVIKKYGADASSDPVLLKHKSGTPHGCYALFSNSAKDPDDVVTLQMSDFDTKRDLYFNMADKGAEITFWDMHKASKQGWWLSAFFGIHKIDPELFNMIYDVLLS